VILYGDGEFTKHALAILSRVYFEVVTDLNPSGQVTLLPTIDTKVILILAICAMLLELPLL
jgi:hypothetical protein